MFEQKHKHSWAEVQILYTNLNEARKKFAFNTVDIPSNPGKTYTSSVKTLNDIVNAMSNHKFLTNVAVTGVILPNSKDKLKAEPFLRISETIERIKNTCDYCDYTAPCSFSDSCGCGPHGTFGFDGSSCRGFSHASSSSGGC